MPSPSSGNQDALIFTRISIFFRNLLACCSCGLICVQSGDESPSAGNAPTTLTDQRHRGPHIQHLEKPQEIEGTARHAPEITYTECPEQRGSRVVFPRHVEAGPGAFNGASHFVVKELNITEYDRERAMESLEKYTIRGAEFDSSDRSPPPHCHPGTRKSIVERTHRWLGNIGRQKRILWMVGSAGVGKSAIMQTLAEYADHTPKLKLGATLFFSRPNGRNNPFKVFITLAYQIALVSPPYREFVVREVVNNPRLPTKSMKVQFTRLFVEPFAQRAVHQESGDLLIFLDGLDECEGHSEQCEIVELISSFSLAHPNAPLIWIIASRPESHLKAVFSRTTVVPSYEKEEVPIDSDEACADVEKYLRKEFVRIQQDDPVTYLLPRWPTETQFLTITAAVGGLFAFASTVIKFVGDPIYKNPTSALALLLAAINKVSLQPSKGRPHPLAYLDELYTCILSEIPEGILPDTISLLTNYHVLSYHPTSLQHKNLAFLCNWIGMPPNDAYSALDRLHSVLTIPLPKDAGRVGLSFHHQSFYEYVLDPKRSRAFHIGQNEIDKQELDCSIRILKDVHQKMDAIDHSVYPVSAVVLSWPKGVMGEAMREHLYDCAAWSFIGVTDRYHPDLVLSKLQDSGVARVIETFNFVDPRSIVYRLRREDARFFSGPTGRMQPQRDRILWAEFKRLGLLRTIPIRMIHRDCIEDSVPIYASNDGGYNLYCLTALFGSAFAIDYDSKSFSWLRPNRFRVQNQEYNLQLLWHVLVRHPDVLVMYLGNALRGHLIIRFTSFDGRGDCIFYIPYRPPS